MPGARFVEKNMTETRLAVDIYSDIACPWCFIGKRRFEKAVQALPFGEKVDVKWHAFQLDPSLPEHYEGSELDYLVKANWTLQDVVNKVKERLGM